jgi:hypothetical protein
MACQDVLNVQLHAVSRWVFFIVEKYREKVGGVYKY